MHQYRNPIFVSQIVDISGLLPCYLSKICQKMHELGKVWVSRLLDDHSGEEQIEVGFLGDVVFFQSGLELLVRACRG